MTRRCFLVAVGSTLALITCLTAGCDNPNGGGNSAAVAPVAPPPAPPADSVVPPAENTSNPTVTPQVPTDEVPKDVVGGGTTQTPAVEKSQPQFPKKTDWGKVTGGVEIPIADRPTVVFAAHGQPLVATGNAVYSLTTGETVGRIGANWQTSSAVYALSPGGKILATCYRDKELNTQVIQFVDCETGQMTNVAPIKRDETSVLTAAVEFIDDERIAWLGRIGQKQGIVVLNAADGSLAKAVEVPAIGTLKGAASPNGQHFAVTDGKGLVIYDLESGEVAAQLARPPDREGINLGFTNCKDLAFSFDGEEVAGLFSTGPGLRLVVWNAMTEVVLDEVVVGAQVIGFKAQDVLQWSPDGSGFLLAHRKYFDRGARQVVWELEIQNIAQPPIKFVGEDRLVTFSRKGRHKVGLVEMAVPKAEIQQALASMQSEEALLKPGDSVTLDIQIGAVRYASAQEVADELTELFAERFRSRGIDVAPGQPVVLSLNYSEAAGAVTQIVERDQFGRNEKTVGTTTQTETSLDIKLTADDGKTLLWEKSRDVGSSQYGVVSSTDPKALRNSRYSTMKTILRREWMPYFVARGEDVPALPLLTRP